MEEQENGFRYTGNKRVCARCMRDGSLMKFIAARGDDGECDFCSTPDSQSVGLRDLFLEMSRCIRHEFMPASISDDIPGPEWELDPTSLRPPVAVR